MKKWKNRKFLKRKLSTYLMIILVLTLGIVGVKWNFHSEAAENAGIWLEEGGVKVTGEITMDTSAINLGLGSSGTQYADPKYKIQWVIPIQEDRDIIQFQDDGSGNNYDRMEESLFNCVIEAKNPGTAELDVYVYDSTGLSGGEEVAGTGMTIAQHVTVKINVVFAIDTQLDDAYQYVYGTDEKRSLVMYVDEEQKMKLNVGSASDSNILWQSQNKDVVEIVTKENGDIYTKAKGSGVTTISADGLTGHDSIKVYVIPKISMTGEEGSFSKEGVYNVHSGDWIYTDAIFNENKTLTINDKMVWVISKYDMKNNKVVIEDSIGSIESDLIELDTMNAEYPQNLKISAKAGQYIIDFYPSGTYTKDGKSDKIAPTTVILNVCAEFDDREVNLIAGDQFSIPDALNITLEEFSTWFTVDFRTQGDIQDTSYSNYLKYESTDQIVTALAATEQKSYVMSIHVKEGYQDKVNALLENDKKNTTPEFTFRVVDELLLSMRNVSIVVGEEMQLIASTSTYEGTLVWTSSDEKYVTVSETGVIKGIAKTEEDITITVTQKLNDGSIKKAICKVKVEETVKNIVLTDTSVEMLEGTVKTVSATFNPDRNEAPIQWMCSDEEVCTINVSSDKKSVVISAKKEGTAVLTAINEDNYVSAVCKITVLAQIKSISLPEAQMTVRLNQEVIRLVASYAPAKTTNNKLEWASSDPSVATVDDSGLVTLLKAGITIITVKPQYNTTPPVMAQCIITVEQSSEGIALDQSSITLEAGQTRSLSYILTPDNATTEVTWTSLDSSVATVSDRGVIKAVKAGSTFVSVTSSDGYSATCKVTVTQQATGIKVSTENLSLGVGDSFTMGVTITPEDSTDTTVTWTTQDAKIAKVTSDGKITGVAVGSTVILAKIKNGEVAYVNVTVRDKVKSVVLDEEKKTILVGKSFQLTANVTPANATNTKVSWQSSDEKVATVSEKGKVTGVKGGNAMIVCTTEDGGYTAHCLVTVEEKVSGVTLDKESYKMKVNQTVTLNATVASQEASVKAVKWTTSNKKIATVNQSGKVTAKKAGTCIITATATDGTGESASCKIKVIKNVSSLKINLSYVKLMEGKSKKIKSKVSPASASIKALKWTSENPEIAIVNGNGKVTAIAPGTTTVKVSTTDGTKIVASCVVEVMEELPVTSMTAETQDITMIRGTTQNASITISPTNTTDKIRYTSDAKSIVSINSKGKMKAKRPGVATITASSSSGKEVSINVTVVGLNKTYLNLQQYDSDELWVEEISDNVKWSSSNPAIARVNNGTVVARKVGNCTITATVKGVKLTCKVNVVRIQK